MKKLLFLFFIPLLVLSGGFYFHLIKQAETSKKAPQLGLKNGKLLPCPDKPNCINSEFPNEPSSVDAIPFPDTTKNISSLKENIKVLLILNNGNLIDEDTNYLRFEYMTPKMKFVDDLELRLDRKEKLIHIRSASRVGYGDMGANKHRYEKIKKILASDL